MAASSCCSAAPNQALGDKPYEAKRDAYIAHGESLLTRSLHPLAYESNPAFRAFIQRTGLPFRAYDHFDPEAQRERQKLYLRLAEWVWNPSRLDLDGLKPPEPGRLDANGAAGSGLELGSVREEMRLRFWTPALETRQVTERPPRPHLSEYDHLGGDPPTRH